MARRKRHRNDKSAKVYHSKRANERNAKRAGESRDAESRIAHAREMVKNPGALLKTPPAPPGIVYEWKTYSILGKRRDGFYVNLQKGWEPVDPDSIPNKHLYPLDEYHDGTSVISIGGMILCQIDETLAQVYSSEYEERALRQQNSLRAQAFDQFRSRYGPAGVADPDHQWGSNFDSTGRTVQINKGLLG